jgi:hypothetical protein
MTDLDTATTQELIDELRVRHDCSVIVLVRPTKDGRHGQSLVQYGGFITHAYGLANLAVRTLEDRMIDMSDAEEAEESE